jgi:hypothetical protein
MYLPLLLVLAHVIRFLAGATAAGGDKYAIHHILLILLRIRWNEEKMFYMIVPRAIGLLPQLLADDLAQRRRSNALAKDGMECIVRIERMVTCKLVSTARRQSISGPTGNADVRREDARIHLYLSVCVTLRVTVCLCECVYVCTYVHVTVCVLRYKYVDVAAASAAAYIEIEILK